MLLIATLLWGLLPASTGARAEPSLGAPFTLTDQNGETRTDRDFRGSYMLVYFGYTSCPDTCPASLAKMGGALDRVAERDSAKASRIVPIFITVDPERDTVPLLKSYAAHFHPRLVALTGDAAGLRALSYAYGVHFAKASGGGRDTYLMDHTSFIYLMGRDGQYITHFEANAAVDELAEGLTARVETAGLQ